MEQIGYVVDVYDNRVKIKVRRESACGGNCVSCKGCPSGTVYTEVYAEGFKKGDIVTISMKNGDFLKNAFWGYGLATILAITGAGVAYTFFHNEGASVFGAFIGIVAGIIIAKTFKGNVEHEIKIQKYVKDNG